MTNFDHIKISELVNFLGVIPDILICSASFENRCLSMPLSNGAKSIRKVLVFHQNSSSNFTTANNQSLLENFKENALSITLSASEPLENADKIDESLIRIFKSEPCTCLIDITTFTRETLLILFKILVLRKKAEDKIFLSYTSAREYAPLLPNDEKWLSKGIASIRSIVGYPGFHLPSRKFHLIILSGFETERAVKLIETFESSIVSVGLGDPNESISDELYSINSSFYKKLCEVYPDINQFNFSCRDPITAKNQILEIAQKHPDHNIVIAPLNNKLSTLGAALSSLESPQIQICYAQPHSYNYSGYSISGDECFVFDFDQLVKPFK